MYGDFCVFLCGVEGDFGIEVGVGVGDEYGFVGEVGEDLGGVGFSYGGFYFLV